VNFDVTPTDDARHPTMLDIVDFHDGDLDPATSDALATHISWCQACSNLEAGISERFDTIEPDLPEPFDLPSELVHLLRDVPAERPLPGELWLLDWEGERLLGVVQGRGERPLMWTVAPATIEADDELTGSAAEITEEASPIGLPIRIWAQATVAVEQGVFLHRAGTLPNPEQLDRSDDRPGASSWGAAAILAGLGRTLDTLGTAQWIPASDTSAVDAGELMAAQRLQPTDVEAATGIPASRVRDIARGVVEPSPSEAQRLAELLGTDPDAVRSTPEPPLALIDAVSSPMRRPAIRLRAMRDGVSEAVARWSATVGVMAMPARTSGVERDADAWDDLLEQYLDGE
jgi:hypothetical protein